MLSHKPSTFAGELVRDGLISYGIKRVVDDVEFLGICVRTLSRIHPIKKGGDKKKGSQ